MEEMFRNFVADATSSDFFAGGLALGGFGVAVAYLRVVLMTTYRFILRRVWVSLTLDNRSAAYRYFLIWMEANGVLARAKHVRMTDGRWTRGTRGFAPARGRHWFFRDGKLCRLDRGCIF